MTAVSVGSRVPRDRTGRARAPRAPLTGKAAVLAAQLVLMASHRFT